MSDAQFDAALLLTRLSGLSAGAARLVLVGGASQAGAAHQLGIRHRQQVSRAVGCIRRAAQHGGVCTVCGSKVEEEALIG